MDMHKLVGRRVKEIRDRRGLSQKEFGIAVGRHLGEDKTWSNKVVSFVETGERQLDSSELLIVAAVLEVPVYELMRPRPDEEVELPSGEVMNAVEVTRHVVGFAGADPRFVNVAGQMVSLADIAEELAREARAAASVLAGQRRTEPWLEVRAREGERIAIVEVPEEESKAQLLAEHYDDGGGRVELLGAPDDAEMEQKR